MAIRFGAVPVMMKPPIRTRSPFSTCIRSKHSEGRLLTSESVVVNEVGNFAALGDSLILSKAQWILR